MQYTSRWVNIGTMKQIKVSLRQDQIDAIRKLAEFSGQSQAYVIRYIIDHCQDEISQAIEAWRANPAAKPFRKGEGGFQPL